MSKQNFACTVAVGDSAVALGQHNRKWPLPPRPFGVIAGTKPLYPNTVSYITNAFGLLEGILPSHQWSVLRGVAILVLAWLLHVLFRHFVS